MIITVFRSRLLADVREEYLALAERMSKLAATMPGYISHKGFFADDGERVTIVEFESREAVQAWRLHPEHVEAQRQGRLRFYSQYQITTCEVLHQSAFAREQAA
jgi:heme-degrading monooxygenase HmoA